MNRAADGSSIRYADAGGQSVEWSLEYAELVDEEAAALEDFFRETEGRLKTFVFPDPLGNLLAWSERFEEATWQADPQLALAGDLADPMGTTRAYLARNNGAATQGLRQTVGLPANRTYCFSVYAKAASPAAVTLARGGEGTLCAVGTEWSRLILAGQSEAASETVTFGVELAAGVEVRLFGAQVEAQIGASGYKRTTSRGGVYGAARFRDEELRITAEGVNRHSCRVHITHAYHI
jgi:hypothetical protein